MGHHDHNLRSAYLHVLADALTSVTALVALFCGMWLGWAWMDPLMGVIGSGVIVVWSYGLLRDTSAVLLDAEESESRKEGIRKRIQADGDCAIVDLHLWRVGGKSHACILSVVTHRLRPASDFKRLLANIPGLDHVTIEVNQCRTCPPAQHRFSDPAR